MKRILLTMSLCIFIVVLVNAEQKDIPMNSDKKEVRKDSVDTIKVVKETPVKINCCFDPMPSFPGNIQQFLRTHLVWPSGRKNKNVEGRVIVKFYIDRDGSCSQFKVLRSLNLSFDAEALRVLKLMPKWNMSSMEGNGDWYVLPVYFKKEKAQQ